MHIAPKHYKLFAVCLLTEKLQRNVGLLLIIITQLQYFDDIIRLILLWLVCDRKYQPFCFASQCLIFLFP